MCERRYSLTFSRCSPAQGLRRLSCTLWCLFLLGQLTPSLTANEPRSASDYIERLSGHLQTLERQVSELEELLSEHEQLSLEQEQSLMEWRLRHNRLERSFLSLRSTFDEQVASIEAERDAEAARAAVERRIGRIEGAAAGVGIAAVSVLLVLLFR